MSEKKLWNIFHQHEDADKDNLEDDLVGTVYGTSEEIEAYCAKWNNPRRYGGKYGPFFGVIYAEEVAANADLDTLIPYDEDVFNRLGRNRGFFPVEPEPYTEDEKANIRENVQWIQENVDLNWNLEI